MLTDGDLVGITILYPLGADSYDPTLGNVGIQVHLASGGVMTYAWDGKHTGGDWVGDGSYILKAERVDTTGTSTTLFANIVVLHKKNRMEVSIYSQSGELVRRLYDSRNVTGKVTYVVLEGDPLILRATTDNRVKILLYDPSNALISDAGGALSGDRLQWNGTNARGSYVSTGDYLLKVEEHYLGEKVVATRNITVVRYSMSGFLSAKAYPNPWHAGAGKNMSFNIMTSQDAVVGIKLYNIAGEAVGSLYAPYVAGGVLSSMDWDVSHVASGTYLGLVEARSLESGVTEKKVVKVIIVK
jgi:flagellar hook assembly protein FlgD